MPNQPTPCLNHRLCQLALFGCLCFASCQTPEAENKPEKAAASQSEPGKSVEHIQVQSQQEAQKILDSLLKAEGGNVQITVSGTSNPVLTGDSGKTQIHLMNFKKLDSILSNSHQKYTFVHFWATWCKPCREEFPELLNKLSKMDNTEVVLVCCDYDSKEQRSKIASYYKRLNCNPPLYLLEQSNKLDLTGKQSQQEFIRQYSPTAEGGLPFNMVFRNSSKRVVAGSNNYQKAFAALAW